MIIFIMNESFMNGVRYGLVIKGLFRTNKGKVRPYNEDNGLVSDEKNDMLLAAVADGMGGHSAGDVASSMAVEHVKKAWAQIQSIMSVEEQVRWLDETVKKANEHIITHARNNPECSGMGTTLITVICNPEEIAVSNVGDSRLYHFSAADNSVRQVTNDHSIPGELVRKGYISEAEADVHPQKNVLTQALGTDMALEADIEHITWKEGDILLLCSDGLSDKLTRNDLSEIFQSYPVLEEAAEEMIAEANRRGGEDNISTALVENRPKGVTGND